MQLLVGTAPVALPIDPGETAIIQNLGTGDIAIDYDSDVTMSTGLEIKADDAYELPGDLRKTLYAIASVAATDVRILIVG